MSSGLDSVCDTVRHWSLSLMDFQKALWEPGLGGGSALSRPLSLDWGVTQATPGPCPALIRGERAATEEAF